MRTVRFAFAGVCAVVLLVMVVASWARPRPDLTRSDARAFTEEALTELGLEAVDVSPRVEPGRYRPEGADPEAEPLPVWKTSAITAEGRVGILVSQEVGRAVFVRDEAFTGGPLLDDDQFARLRRFEHDEARDRWLSRNIARTIFGVIGAGIAVVLALTVWRPGRRRSEAPVEAPL